MGIFVKYLLAYGSGTLYVIAYNDFCGTCVTYTFLVLNLCTASCIYPACVFLARYC